MKPNNNSSKVTWPCEAHPESTWGQILYAATTMLRNNEKDLPIELTNAIFALEPNKATLKVKSNMQAIAYRNKFLL